MISSAELLTKLCQIYLFIYLNDHRYTHMFALSLVLGSFSPLGTGLLKRSSLEKRRQREPADGCWVKDMWYDVGETFRRDGCKDVRCTCYWDGQVSCRQEGNECEFRFFREINSNDHSFGCPTVYTDTTHNTNVCITNALYSNTYSLIGNHIWR